MPGGRETSHDLQTHTEVPSVPREPDYADPSMVGLSLVLAVALTGVVWMARNATAPKHHGGLHLVEAPVAVPRVEATPEPEPAHAETVPPVSPPVALEPPVEPPVVEPVGILDRFREALGKTRHALQGQLDTIFGRAVDESLFEDLEEALLGADVGVVTAGRIIDKVREVAKAGDAEPQALRSAMKREMRAILDGVDSSWKMPADGPWVILVVGVNGSGKTTTIGKLAARLKRSGKTVVLAAADTYRAAAAEQLTIWAERADVEIVSLKEGADPGAVVYDAMSSAASKGTDVVIVDTAGRLQTQKPLMEQLSKIRRVIQKRVADGPHETLLVLDGTIGQNGLSQAVKFNEATPLTGVAITKLDGTAKGGMVLTVAAEMSLPVKLVGIGEQVDDLKDFDAAAFVDALA